MKSRFNIIGNRKIFLTLSTVLVAASVAVIVVFGFVPGIDFVGGTLWQVKFEDTAEPAAVTEALGVLEDKVDVYRSTTDDSLIIKTKQLSEEQHQYARSILIEEFGSIEELRFESIGPTIGVQLRNRSMRAAIFVLLAISLYIAISFRKVSYPVKSWKYGVVVLITLFHDVIIPTGVLAVLGQVVGVEMNTNFVVALLVIMGFSVHDTIVVFDRIREGLLRREEGVSFDDVVNVSVNQTITRSINTSLTLIVILAAMLIIGASSLQFFVLTVLIGTVVGTYSSIFLAAPLLTFWHKFGTNK